VVRAIWKLDRRIRYAGILDKDGRLLAGGMRRGIRPLEPQSEELRLMIQIVTESNAWASWDDYFGKTLYAVIHRELVTFFIIPYDGHLLVVTTEPDFPMEGVQKLREVVSAHSLHASSYP
jgi:hypothetical protein